MRRLVVGNQSLGPSQRRVWRCHPLLDTVRASLKAHDDRAFVEVEVGPRWGADHPRIHPRPPRLHISMGSNTKQGGSCECSTMYRHNGAAQPSTRVHHCVCVCVCAGSIALAHVAEICALALDLSI